VGSLLVEAVQELLAEKAALKRHLVAVREGRGWGRRDGGGYRVDGAHWPPYM
jgi:hypothetical protein